MAIPGWIISYICVWLIDAIPCIDVNVNASKNHITLLDRSLIGLYMEAHNKCRFHFVDLDYYQIKTLSILTTRLFSDFNHIMVRSCEFIIFFTRSIFTFVLKSNLLYFIIKHKIIVKTWINKSVYHLIRYMEMSAHENSESNVLSSCVEVQDIVNRLPYWRNWKYNICCDKIHLVEFSRISMDIVVCFLFQPIRWKRNRTWKRWPGRKERKSTRRRYKHIIQDSCCQFHIHCVLSISYTLFVTMSGAYDIKND